MKLKLTLLESQFVGMALLTSLLLYLSLFFPISKLVFLLISIPLCLYPLFDKKNFRESFKLKFNKILAIIIATMGLVISYLTTLGVKSYDTLVYHHQAVLWLKEFGTVIGLGNLDVRHSYVTSWFHLNAFWDISKVYSLTSYFFFLALIYFTLGLHEFIKNKSRIGMYRSFSGIFLVYFFNTIPSLSTDLPVAVLIILVGDLLVQKKSPILISLISFFAFSIKFSAIFLLIPLFIHYRSYWRYHLTFLFSFTVPLMVRSIMTSGFLFYPLTALGIFDVPWKIPPFIFLGDLKFISAWAKIPRVLVSVYDSMSFFDWFLIWVKVPVNALILIVGIILIVLFFIRPRKLYLTIPVFITILIWFLNTPDVRFIVGTIALFAGLISLSYLKKISPNSFKLIAILIIMLFLVGSFLFYITTPFSIPVEEYDVETFSHPFVYNNVTYYIPVEESICGNSQLPCTLILFENITLRGNHFSTGFYFP